MRCCLHVRVLGWLHTHALVCAVVYILCLYMGAVSVVTTVKWFWFLVALIALFGIIVSLARSFKVTADP